MTTRYGSVQQQSVCTRLALWRPWMVKFESGCGRTDRPKDAAGLHNEAIRGGHLLPSRHEALKGQSVVELVKRGLSVPQPRSR
jgi:hypothetical protein